LLLRARYIRAALGELQLKLVRWSSHAKRMLLKREVEQAEAEQTLTHPDEILPGQPPRMVYQRVYFDRMLGQEMLLRLVVEESEKSRWL
jgi:hypothetical protein